MVLNLVLSAASLQCTNSLSVVRINPEKGAEFATNLVKDANGPLIDIERAVDIFQSQALYQNATSFLLDVLSGNSPEQAQLQTRLLEMNLMHAPQVADAILGNDMFSHFDRPRIASMCEQAGLATRALELSEDPAAIKRLIVQTDKLSEEWLLNYFGKLSVEQSLDCLNEMLRVNIRQNLQFVIRIAQKYSDLLGPTNIIDLLEKYRTAEGLYFYLGGIVNVSEEKDVHFKYIEAATKMGQLTEVERICRESSKSISNVDKTSHGVYQRWRAVSWPSWRCRGPGRSKRPIRLVKPLPTRSSTNQRFY